MEKLFYMSKTAFPSSEHAVKRILAEFFGYTESRLVKNEHGKPFLENTPVRLFLSVSHTDELLFIALSDENVGVDAEALSRTPDYLPIVKKFPTEERAEIKTCEDFLLHWTVKEAAIKWLGGTLAHDLKKLSYIKGRLAYNGLDIPVSVTVKEIGGHLVAVCGERNFEHVETVAL